MKCIICKKNYSGKGHDAKPIRDGLCCDICNFTVVKERLRKKAIERKL